MIKTRITELLAIEYPIFQGGMAWISDGKLAAAVSNGGGLGIIASMNADAAFLREQIRICRSLTDKPFAVNIMLMSPYAEEVAETVREEGVPVVTTGAGSPARFMEGWLAAGIKVIPVIASVAMAKKMQRSGAHAVVAEGCEAGGHIGELTTMALVPQVCDAVDLPVLAAGGIADGRAVAAALMLGAEGVQVGTRFLVAEECGIHANYKNIVIAAKDIDTITTGKRFGHNVRSIKTYLSRILAVAEQDLNTSQADLEKLAIDTLRIAVQEGDEQRGIFHAGQAAGLVKQEQPAAAIIQEIFAETEQCLKAASKWLS